MEPNQPLTVWTLALFAIQALLAIAGFVVALMINRLIKTVDGLTAADTAIREQILAYREDMLRNYVRNDQLEPIKKDILGRVDRMELSFKEALMAHEHRELRMYQMGHSGGAG